MEAGEIGVDYVFFGRPHGDTHDAPHPKALDLAEWWSELMEIPAVVMAGRSLDSVAEAAATGAAFVALHEAVWSHPAGRARPCGIALGRHAAGARTARGMRRPRRSSDPRWRYPPAPWRGRPTIATIASSRRRPLPRRQRSSRIRLPPRLCPIAAPALAAPALAQPDVSLAAPAGKAGCRRRWTRTRSCSRIDKGMTAAGEKSAIPPDYAYGAFQRGFFLTAFSLALERAKKGDAPAQTLLGELLSRGLGVKQDLAAAADWYGLAAGHGDRGSALRARPALPRRPRRRAGRRRRRRTSSRRPPSQDNAGAAREFAYLLLQGKGREQNALLAAAYLRRAARLGDMDAQYSLAELYVEGVGVVADEALAARWFGEAARNGHVGAQVEYGIILFNGRGVKKDEAVAARWFNEAANSDNPLAQVRLARLYAEGRGVDKEPGRGGALVSDRQGARPRRRHSWRTG